jgi:hypothetical protein
MCGKGNSLALDGQNTDDHEPVAQDPLSLFIGCA